MSRRTSDASKAIRLAWEKEQKLILNGEGTRDWNQKQQQDIIDKGKAYDEEGKAFEGQHMKSAAEYPDYQGDPDNIQFLSHQEHFEAHKGNWQNPTNWYYDPIKKEYHDFGEGKFIPCEVIDLSSPIINSSQKELLEAAARLEKQAEEMKKRCSGNTKTNRTNSSTNKSNVAPDVNPTNVSSTGESFIIRGFYKAIDGWRNFKINHPILYGLITEGTKAAIGAGITYGVSRAAGGAHSSPNLPTANPNLTKAVNTSKPAASAIADSIKHGTHASPIEHMVSGYTRTMNGKVIHVDPYKRGGQK